MSGSTTEHRFLSVMFCDMVDSTRHQYQMDPERFAEILSDYRSTVSEVVRRHGGHVARVIGDGILAYFGWPQAQGHDAQAAVSCALEICTKIAASGADLSPQANSIQVRLAIETGWVLVGTIGVAGEPRKDDAELSGVVGHAPNVAARLQRLAARNGVVVGEVTISLIGDKFIIEDVDSTGIDLPVPVAAARVLRRTAPENVMQRLGRGSSFLVGRSAPLLTLQKCWSAARGGQGRFILVSGEPGIGKSRLAASIVTEAQREGYIIAVNCAAAMSNSVFQPLIEPLRSVMGLQTTDDSTVNAAAEKLLARFGISKGASALAAILGVASPNAAPADLRQATFDVLLKLLEQLWLERPVLLLVEDLQWADASTLELLRRLSQNITTGRVMVVATHRSTWEANWPEAPALMSVRLGPLSKQEARIVVDAINPEIGETDKTSIIARSEGIPFFLEEFVRSTMHRGNGSTRLPGSISQLLTARLDSVGTSRDLIQISSAVGQEVDVSLLSELTDRSPDSLALEIDLLGASGIMSRRGEGTATKLAFRHALLADAAYEAMTNSKRQALHRQIATVLQARQPTDSISEPEVLGRHHALGGNTEQAATLFRAASSNALATAAYAEATAHAKRAIELSETLVGGETKQRAKLEATVLLGESLSGPLGYASSEVRSVFEDASRIAMELGSVADLQPVLRGLTAYYQIRGPLHRAHELGRRAVQVARARGNQLQLAEAERRWGWCRLCQGELEEARLLVESAMNRLSKASAASPDKPIVDDSSVRGPGILAMIAWLVDGRDHALNMAHEMARQAEEFPRPTGKIYALGFASFVFQLCGDAETAHRLASIGGETALTHNNLYWLSLSKIVSGWAEVTGRSDPRGMEKIHIGLKEYESLQSVILHPYALMLLADAEDAIGDSDLALSTLGKAIEIAESSGARFYIPILQSARGTILIRQSAPQSRSILDIARTEALNQGALALVARIDLTLERMVTSPYHCA